jgi:hypothetical protein
MQSWCEMKNDTHLFGILGYIAILFYMWKTYWRVTFVWFFFLIYGYKVLKVYCSHIRIRMFFSVSLPSGIWICIKIIQEAVNWCREDFINLYLIYTLNFFKWNFLHKICVTRILRIYSIQMSDIWEVGHLWTSFFNI